MKPELTDFFIVLKYDAPPEESREGPELYLVAARYRESAERIVEKQFPNELDNIELRPVRLPVEHAMRVGQLCTLVMDPFSTW